MRLRVFILAFILCTVSVTKTNAQDQPLVFVPELATVRSGPGTVYDRLGELTTEQTAPALGRSALSDWIQVEYVSPSGNRGWVYAPFVELRGITIEALPVVEAPPTATLPPTPEGEPNPFVAATPPLTRRPTFTPAPTVEIPHYAEVTATRPAFPPMALILAFFAVAILGIVMAVIRRNA